MLTAAKTVVVLKIASPSARMLVPTVLPWTLQLDYGREERQRGRR